VASTCNGSLELFQDRHGLAFECSVDGWDAVNLANAIARRDIEHVSVNFTDMQFEDHGDRRRIVSAKIDHIALLPSGAYPDTSVWMAGVDYYDLPQHVRAASRDWQTGWLLNDIQRKRVAREVAANANEMRANGGNFSSGHGSGARTRDFRPPLARSRPSVPESVRNLMAQTWFGPSVFSPPTGFRFDARARGVVRAGDV
jgi:hypothetical protein